MSDFKMSWFWNPSIDPTHPLIEFQLKQHYPWKPTVFASKFDTRSNPWTKFVDFAANTLGDLVSKVESNALRLKLLSLLDCLLPMVHDIVNYSETSSEAYFDRKWWETHMNSSIPLPIPSSIPTSALSRIWEGSRYLLRFNESMTTSKILDNPIDQLIRSGWPQKHRIQHFVNTCAKFIHRADLIQKRRASNKNDEDDDEENHSISDGNESDDYSKDTIDFDQLLKGDDGECEEEDDTLGSVRTTANRKAIFPCRVGTPAKKTEVDKKKAKRLRNRRRKRDDDEDEDSDRSDDEHEYDTDEEINLSILESDSDEDSKESQLKAVDGHIKQYISNRRAVNMELAHRSLLKWWILFRLGMYPNSRAPCIDYEQRMKYLQVWNRTESSSLKWVIRQIIGIIRQDDSIPLLFSIKEFTFYGIRMHASMRAWLVECSDWVRYERDCIESMDRYRITGDKMHMSDYLKHQYAIGMMTHAPFNYWDHMNEYISESSLTTLKQDPNEIWPSPSEIYTCMHAWFERQWDIMKIPFDPKQENPFEGIHPSCMNLFLLTRRLIEWGLSMFQASVSAIDFCIKTVVSYHKRKCGKNSITKTINNIKTTDARTYYIWSHIIKSRLNWRKLKQVTLPDNILRIHQRLLRERCTIEEQNHPRIDWILYCPNCWEIRTFLVPAYVPYYTKRKTSLNTCGFTRVVVDHTTGKLYCGRKNGKQTPICSKTELCYVHSTGHMTYLNNKCIVNCGHCRRLMILGSHSRQYDELTWICSICIRKREAFKVKRQKEAQINKQIREERAASKKQNEADEKGVQPFKALIPIGSEEAAAIIKAQSSKKRSDSSNQNFYSEVDSKTVHKHIYNRSRATALYSK